MILKNRFVLSAKMVFLAALFFFAGESASQTLFGIDISDPDNTKGYQYNNSLDAAGTEVFVKNDPGIFDRVLLNKGLGYVCTINHPTANRFVAVYDSLLAAYGYESENKDVIPPEATGDIIELCLMVSDGQARIVRFWYERRFNIKLDFGANNLEVFISFF